MQENDVVPMTNSPQTTEVQPLTVDSRPKASNFLVILLSILLLLSVLIAGFFAFQTQKLVAELRVMNTLRDKNEELIVKTPEPTTEPIATDSSTVDPTANWKTYTNTKFNFSFKYPNDSVIKTDMILADGSIEFSNFIFLLEKTDGTLINYVNKLKDTNGATSTTKMVNKFEVVEWIGSYKNAPTHYMSILNNGSVFNLGITATDNMTQFVSTETKLLDQILSTFQFTN